MNRGIRNVLTVAALAVVFGLGLAAPATARADDPSFLTLSAGHFDFNRRKDPGGEFGLEYRDKHKFLWIFKPVARAAYISNGMTFVGVGVRIDAFFGKRFVITPSFIPTWWRGKTSKLDLGYPLEFRSAIEFAYRFDNRARLGVAVSHTSNAHLGDKNPGTEALLVNYSIPLNW